MNFNMLSFYLFFLGNHVVHMRSKAMFDSYVDINDEICQTGEVPKWNYNPKYTGFSNHCQHGTNIPGKITRFIYNLGLRYQ